jgi:hypothetical protein
LTDTPERSFAASSAALVYSEARFVACLPQTLSGKKLWCLDDAEHWPNRFGEPVYFFPYFYVQSALAISERQTEKSPRLAADRIAMVFYEHLVDTFCLFRRIREGDKKIHGFG